jgi:hypothetical protein
MSDRSGILRIRCESTSERVRSMDAGEAVGEVLGFVIFFGILATVIAGGVLVLMVLWRLAFVPRRPMSPRLPSPPDDWDDEEYIARHHH